MTTTKHSWICWRFSGSIRRSSQMLLSMCSLQLSPEGQTGNPHPPRRPRLPPPVSKNPAGCSITCTQSLSVKPVFLLSFISTWDTTRWTENWTREFIYEPFYMRDTNICFHTVSPVRSDRSPCELTCRITVCSLYSNSLPSAASCCELCESQDDQAGITSFRKLLEN